MRFVFASLLAVIIGFAADLVFGDPSSRFHPICLIGNFISYMEKTARRIFPETPKGERTGGVFCGLTVILVSAGIPLLLLLFFYRISILLGLAAEAVLCYFALSVKTLKKESVHVAEALEEEGLEAGRKAVSRIVGRDTQSLTREGVMKAAVETVAENYSDGVAAPLFYMILLGAPGGYFYKSINTMDSMLGYKNERYLNFGRFAAKLDDAVNFIPARLAALFLILSAFLCGQDGKMAWKIFRRDRFNHASPNSAQTESAAAGALHVQLAGDAWYFGKLYKKPVIGDDIRPVETEDIRRINQMMITASAVALAVFVCAKTFLLWFCG